VDDVNPDGLPMQGRVEEIEGLLLACGCHGYGFSLTQVMGKAVADIIGERLSFAVVEKLNLSRFGPEFRKYPSRWYGRTME
jgi:glycine/D-amino acid oxidase-like deaminating enzyme